MTDVIVNYDEYHNCPGKLAAFNPFLSLIKGHNGKFTLGYQNRPYYQYQTAADPSPLKAGGRLGQLTLQYQVFI